MRTILLSVLFIASPSLAADWPQWRGPDRNGISRETGWLEGWPQDRPPRIAWRAQVGRGHSAMSIASGKGVTLGWDGAKDTVRCLDVATGKVLWEESYPCRGIKQWPGPRASATIDGSTVYMLGQWGQLKALDLATGKPRWAVQLQETYNPDGDYGFAWSPLVEGDLLILSTGAKGLALRKADGSYAWGNDGKPGACASAVPFVHEGRRGVVVFHTPPDRRSSSVAGIDARSGEELWRYGGWKEYWGAVCVDPVVRDGKVLLTSAEEYRRMARFSIAGRTLREDWSSTKLSGYTGGIVLVGEHLYTVDAAGFLHCAEWSTGRIAWTKRGFDAHGSLIAADGKLIIQSGRSGDLVIAEANPAAYRELRRAKVFEGPAETFTAPVLAGGRIYCRSYAGEVVCVDLRR